MKKSELKQIISEEIKNILNESSKSENIGIIWSNITKDIYKLTHIIIDKHDQTVAKEFVKIKDTFIDSTLKLIKKHNLL